MAEPPRQANLFQVYLRLRPPQTPQPPLFLGFTPASGLAAPLSAAAVPSERFLTVEPAAHTTVPTHITLNPPSDRRRQVERFGFTQVFQEDAGQLDVFHCAGVAGLVEAAVAPNGDEGAHALLATLGVTGSGKTHTILGSRTQRGMTQLALDVLFRAIAPCIAPDAGSASFAESLQESDPSESVIISAAAFFRPDGPDDPLSPGSRAATPMLGDHHHGHYPTPTRRRPPPTLHHMSGGLWKSPDVSGVRIAADPDAEYAVVASMYEVYNDKIFDLLDGGDQQQGQRRRRPLLLKSTEQSPDRKVVAGLLKVVCTTLRDAVGVIDAALLERSVAGTGSNSASSRSHAFFCFEVRKRNRYRKSAGWYGSTLTIADLAGSERAREAKTQGATLVEAGKINKSLMYLGQCLQMQTDAMNGIKLGASGFRHCKLTELLFSSNSRPRRNPQRGVMIVTADPVGDFNATSQILRYSALAREVMLPRNPSLTMQRAGSGDAPALGGPMSVLAHGRHGRETSGSTDDRAMMELAAMDIARLSDEVAALRAGLDAAETRTQMLADRELEREAEVRADCAAAMEARIALEHARWKATWAVEQERAGEHLDRKMDLFERGIVVPDQHHNRDDGESEGENKENILVETLEQENGRLRHQLAVLQRELSAHTPTRRAPLREFDTVASPSPRSDCGGGGGNAGGVFKLANRLSKLRVAATVTDEDIDLRKIRRQAPRRWPSAVRADGEDDDF